MRGWCLIAFTVGTFAAFVASTVLAQSRTDEFSRNRTLEERLRRLGELEKQTPASPTAETSKTSSADAADRPCFVVDRIVIDGVRLFSSDELSIVTAAYTGKCTGIEQINELLRTITHLYLDRGFITSRAYVPEQNVAGTRTLRLGVVEGDISEIYLDDRPAPSSGLLRTAFPGMVGRAANIRDIEQGLDQINRLPSSRATTKMLPGAKDGTSILNVGIDRGRPWHGSLSNDNLGQKQTGLSKTAFSYSHDNLFELNDVTSFTYERTGSDYPGDDDGWGRSSSYSGSFDIPYGYWTLTTNGSWYEYDSVVPGSLADVQTSGTSGQVGMTLKRVVSRGKDSLTELHGGVSYKETDNFLLGNLIEVGSRRYTVGSFGVLHSQRMLGGIWSFDFGIDQGLDLFGAVDADAPGAGNADPRSSKFSGTMTVNVPMEFQGQRYEFSSLVNGQYSPDNLFGAEQISLGGYSNVRGTRENQLFGNNGLFARNEVAWRTMPWEQNQGAAKFLGELRPYFGLDYGRIFAQSRHKITGDDMIGWTVGVRLVGGHVNLDMGYSDAQVGRDNKADTGLFFVSTSVKW